MAVKTESKSAGEFLIAELSMDRCRDNVTVLSGQNLGVGAVIGRVLHGVGRASVPTVVGTGNGTMTNVYAGPDIEQGNYVVTCKTAAANGGVFSVVAPSGKALPDATVGTPYLTSHINFTINDGATDFIVGDVFTIVVGNTAPTVVGTGNGTISGLSLGPDAIPGNYRVEAIDAITNSGRWKVVNPLGNEIAVGTIVAGAGGTLVLSVQRQLNLTITDGGTDFAVGDFFNVAVYNVGQRGKGKVVAWNPVPSTYDGRQHVAGILFAAVDASAADKSGLAIVRDAIVKADDLVYLATVSAAEKVVCADRLDRNLRIVAR